MKKELRELIVMLTDSYKLHHREMYPKNTVKVYSNGTARSSKHYKGVNKDYVVVFGTQRLVRKLQESFQTFFDLPEDEVLTFCEEQLSSFTGTSYSVEHLRYLHRLQKLPLVIKSLPEGTKCPIKVPYMTFYNTDPKCFWLTNYLETYISSEVWSAITSATIANEYREIFEAWATKTVGNTDFVPFQGHDFSMRGMGGTDFARITGLAHLTSFCGSDTIPAYIDAQHYYDSGLNDWEKFDIVTTSVPATEHSIQCAHYNPEDGNELAYLDHILETFPSGIVSIVCDGFDFWKFITEVLPMRKDVIMAREGKVVVRPDSGNIVDIICGTLKAYEINLDAAGRLGKLYYDGESLHKVRSVNYDEVKDEHTYGIVETLNYTISEMLGAIETLYNIFGGSTNGKGYRVLDPHIGLIYGDSVTLQIADEVCSRLADKGFASTNWVAGIGSFTYQFNTRDSHGQAIKATYVEFEQDVPAAGFDPIVIGKEIFKDPATGDGMKKSAKGLLQVKSLQKGDKFTYILNDQVTWEQENKGALYTIFKDGVLLNQTTLQKIRENIRTQVWLTQ